LNYRSTPGKAVDFYRPGNKTYIVISIQNVRNRGDQDEYFIKWGMKDCFLRDQELWETSVSHPTRSIKINIVFFQESPADPDKPDRGYPPESDPIGEREFDPPSKRALAFALGNQPRASKRALHSAVGVASPRCLPLFRLKSRLRHSYPTLLSIVRIRDGRPKMNQRALQRKDAMLDCFIRYRLK
jgi:hypothetical protein